MTETDNLQERLQCYKAAIAQVNAHNKSAVFAALNAAGITDVVVGFDGEGDSGQIDGAAAHAGDEVVDFPDTPVTLQRIGFASDDITSAEMPLPEAIEELCYGYLEQEHGGWENNDGGFGEFTFDVGERRIALEFNGRFTDCYRTCHAF